MAIKKFKVIATRTDEYIVEIDETLYNEEWRESFSNHFWDLDSTEDVAADLALAQIKRGDSHKEGYGYVKKNGKLPFPIHDKEPSEGLNIQVISEDYDYDTEVKDITNQK